MSRQKTIEKLSRLLYELNPDIQSWNGDPYDYDDPKNKSGYCRQKSLSDARKLIAAGVGFNND